jgi:protein XagA
MAGFGRKPGPFGGGALAWAISVAWASAFAPACAFAGAWTQPQGQGLMIETLWGFDGVGAPWGDQPGVKQNRADLQTYAEYGLNDQWTIFGQMAIERYELSRPESSLYAGLDYSELGVRAKLWSAGDWVVSSQATVFAPGARNSASPAQAGNTGWAAEGRMLAGANFALGSTPGFFNLELGYRLRTLGPPDEWHMDATVGLKPWPGVILMLQDFLVVSMPSSDKSFPMWRQNVWQASVVLPLADRWQLQIGYFQTSLAWQTNTERGAAVAVWRRF